MWGSVFYFEYLISRKTTLLRENTGSIRAQFFFVERNYREKVFCCGEKGQFMGGSGVYRFLLPPPPKKKEKKKLQKMKSKQRFRSKNCEPHALSNFFWRRKGRNRSHTPKIARQDPPIKPAIKGAPPYYMRENNCSEKEKKGRFALFVRNRKNVKKEKKRKQVSFFFSDIWRAVSRI